MSGIYCWRMRCDDAASVLRTGQGEIVGRE